MLGYFLCPKQSQHSLHVQIFVQAGNSSVFYYCANSVMSDLSIACLFVTSNKNLIDHYVILIVSIDCGIDCSVESITTVHIGLSILLLRFSILSGHL